MNGAGDVGPRDLDDQKVAVTIQGADQGDTSTLKSTLAQAERQIERKSTNAASLFALTLQHPGPRGTVDTPAPFPA